MQCRGVDSASVPAKKRVSPQTCWTQTPAERFAVLAHRVRLPVLPDGSLRDRPTSARTTVDQPDPLPAGVPGGATLPHWVPFVAADGTVYPGGDLGCAGLAPEAANSADSLQPGNTTYGVADKRGNGLDEVRRSRTPRPTPRSAARRRLPARSRSFRSRASAATAAGTAPAPGLGMPAARSSRRRPWSARSRISARDRASSRPATTTLGR